MVDKFKISKKTDKNIQKIICTFLVHSRKWVEIERFFLSRIVVRRNKKHAKKAYSVISHF